MKKYENVRSAIKPDPIKIDEFSVYISTDIHEITVPDDDGEIYTVYEYTQIRYTKDEYIQFVVNKNADLESEVINTQLALCELYEASI